MDGVYTELRNVFESSYPGVNMYAAKVGPPEDYEQVGEEETSEEGDVVVISALISEAQRR